MEDAPWLKQQSVRVAVRLKRLTPIRSVACCNLTKAETATYSKKPECFLMSFLSLANDEAQGGA